MASNFIDSSLQVSFDAERDNFFNRHGVASFRSICTTLYYICSKCQQATTAFEIRCSIDEGGTWDGFPPAPKAPLRTPLRSTPRLTLKGSGVLKRNTRGEGRNGEGKD